MMVIRYTIYQVSCIIKLLCTQLCSQKMEFINTNIYMPFLLIDRNKRDSCYGNCYSVHILVPIFSSYFHTNGTRHVEVDVWIHA